MGTTTQPPVMPSAVQKRLVVGWGFSESLCAVATGTGDPLPDLVLVATDGSSVNLRDLRGEATLIVFLRHLA